MAFLKTEFRPGAPFGDAGIYGFLFDSCADAAGGFDALAAIVETVGCYGFGAIFVRSYGLGRERGGVCSN